jgi:hypothetical protein
MTGFMLSLALRLAGLFGVRLSPFATGAIVAAGIGLTLVSGAAIAGWKLYDAGAETARAACRMDELQSEVDVLKMDRDNARAAAADATFKQVAIKQAADQEKAKTDDYIAKLEERAKAKPDEARACHLTCDDLRGMRIDTKACGAEAAGARPAAGTRKPAAAGGGPAAWPAR